jgi:hypothetical protein
MPIAATSPIGGTGLKTNKTAAIIAQMLAPMTKPRLRRRKFGELVTISL